MNLALVNATFDRLFAPEPGESELQWPTPEEIEPFAREIEEIKRRNREATPVDWWHPHNPNHESL
jgi:hypothetical protein